MLDADKCIVQIAKECNLRYPNSKVIAVQTDVTIEADCKYDYYNSSLMNNVET